jgi:hypothetical protein
MNMLYEGLKSNATIMVVPSSAVDSMQLGGLAGLTALGMSQRPRRPTPDKVAVAAPSPRRGARRAGGA